MGEFVTRLGSTDYLIVFISLCILFFIYHDAKAEYDELKTLKLYYKITTQYLLGELDSGAYVTYHDNGNFVYLGRNYAIFGLDSTCKDYEGYPIMVIHKRNKELEDSHKCTMSDGTTLQFYMFVYRYKVNKHDELANYFRIKHLL